MRISISLGASLLFVAAFSSAQDVSRNASQAVGSREIWQLTDDERIDARLDPQKMRERAASHTAALSRLHDSGSSTSMSTRTDDGSAVKLIIDGAENPELFLPFELFAHLLRGVDTRLTPEDRNVARAILEAKIRAFGFDPDAFWNAVDVGSRRYFSVRDSRTVAPFANQSPTTGPQAEAIQPPSAAIDHQRAVCRERIIALNATRNHFGSETFNRFLYTVVAPTLTVASRIPGPDERSGLRFLSGGCQ
jgi:hypothetical protein